MGKPGIPEYGEHFALEETGYSRFFDPRLYRFKADYRWYLRSGKGSKSWQVFFAGNPVSNPFPTMREAMDVFLSGITMGMYHVDTSHGIQDFKPQSKLPANVIGGTMTVPEAQARIEALFQSGESMSTVKERIREIVDAVWLQAYEEGLQGVFE